LREEWCGIATGPTTQYLAYDGHGSTRLLTSNTGSVASRFSYDAYGMLLGGQPATLAPAATPFLYTGEQFDSDLQNYNLRARYYDPSNGRFNRLDPFEGSNFDPQSLHKYAYAHQDPVNGIDPTGQFFLLDLLASTFIRSILISIFLPVILSSLRNLAGYFIPKAWLTKVLDSVAPEAFVAGVVGIAGHPYSNFVSVSGGIELLIGLGTGMAAVYGFWGPTFFGRGGGWGVSGSLYAGLVWGPKLSRQYEASYWSLSVLFRMLPARIKEKVRLELGKALINSVILSELPGAWAGLHLESYNQWQFNNVWNKISSMLAGLEDSPVSLFGDKDLGEIFGITIGLFHFSVGSSSTAPPVSFSIPVITTQILPNENVPFV
jgi:RHS repeat-associated protein